MRGQLREMDLQQLRERATLSADERAELHALREGLREASLVELEDRAVRLSLSLSLSLSLFATLIEVDKEMEPVLMRR